MRIDSRACMKLHAPMEKRYQRRLNPLTTSPMGIVCVDMDMGWNARFFVEGQTENNVTLNSLVTFGADL